MAKKKYDEPEANEEILSQSTENATESTPLATDVKMASVGGCRRFKAKSNTGLPNYFRAGLRFTPILTEYEASEEIYESLKKDIHLTVE